MASRIAKVLLSAAGAAALCSVSMGQIVKTKAGYLFRARYVKGMVIKYDLATSVKGGGTSVPPFHIPFTVEVLKVVRGVGTVKITQGAIKMKGQTMSPGSSLVLSLDNRNTAGKEGSPAVGAPLPIKPINPGAAWTSIMPVTLMGQVKQLNAQYRFLGMKVVKGKSLGVIAFTLSGMVDGTGKEYVRASDGTMESSEMTLGLGKGLTGGSSEQMVQVVVDMKRK